MAPATLGCNATWNCMTARAPCPRWPASCPPLPAGAREPETQCRRGCSGQDHQAEAALRQVGLDGRSGSLDRKRQGNRMFGKHQQQILERLVRIPSPTGAEQAASAWLTARIPSPPSSPSTPAATVGNAVLSAGRLIPRPRCPSQRDPRWPPRYRAASWEPTHGPRHGRG